MARWVVVMKSGVVRFVEAGSAHKARQDLKLGGDHAIELGDATFRSKTVAGIFPADEEEGADGAD